jgi:deoxyribodipyrimidine photolyase-related protein
MARAFIVLPNQLVKSLHPNTSDHIILIENNRFFCDFKFHKKKLVFHRASMKYYQHLLEKKKHGVSYLDHKTLSQSAGLGCWLKENDLKQVSLFDPVDHKLKDCLQTEFKKAKIEFEFLSSPLFICQDSYIRDFFSDKEHYSMNSFYISQRKRLDILLDNGKPQGGKWSYDKDNRQKLSKDIQLPQICHPNSNQFVREAEVYINNNFANNPGSTDNFFYPVTHQDAENWLTDFIENRLDLFGPYEDAISVNQSFLFHSLLSPLLNSGLLKAEEVIMGVIDYSQKKQGRLNSLEGFIRQIIGWREFMRAVYILQGQRQKESDFWGFNNKIPHQFYGASTGIEPVDIVVKRVLKHAYTHHIERLMVLGNFMLLCEIDPKEVYRWFMELFIDAYEWVMIPNVFGMSQYADGGMITTKPYISSSNYIRKISDFKAGPWCEIWDSLFWRFIQKHKKVFAQNPRMKIMAVQADRMDKKKMLRYIEKAESYLRQIHKN